MTERPRAGSCSTLVVGAGLAGAALAWLAARRGHRVTLLTVDRPASQATSMSCGHLLGAGPAGPPHQWASLPPPTLAAAAARRARGYDLLRDLVLAARRPVGLRRLTHVVVPAADAPRDWAETTARALASAGFQSELTCGPERAVISGSEMLAHPRRLTFELLRQARRSGADLRFGTSFGRLVSTPDDDLAEVEVEGQFLRVDRVLWASGRSIPGSHLPPPRGSRIALHQVFARGKESLQSVFQAGDGDILLAPHTQHQEQVVMVRMAEESSEGGLRWPEPHSDWNALRGSVVRQRLSEVFFSPPETRFSRSGPLTVISGTSMWPIASVLGACDEALDGE